tara:strand:+ start:1534 stop:1689 length:156 start_codon:yes stop_codon:yes gene_type:complete
MNNRVKIISNSLTIVFPNASKKEISFWFKTNNHDKIKVDNIRNDDLVEKRS